MGRKKFILSQHHQVIHDQMIKFACNVLGRSYKTAHDYTESMERYLPRFMRNFMHLENSTDSIYDIVNLEYLNFIYDSIKNNDEWNQYNKNSHASTLTSGLKCYIQFIQSEYYYGICSFKYV